MPTLIKQKRKQQQPDNQNTNKEKELQYKVTSSKLKNKISQKYKSMKNISGYSKKLQQYQKKRLQSFTFRHHLDGTEMKKVLNQCTSQPRLIGFQQVQNRFYAPNKNLRKVSKPSKELNKKYSDRQDIYKFKNCKKSNEPLQRCLFLYKNTEQIIQIGQKDRKSKNQKINRKNVQRQMIITKRKPNFMNRWNPNTDSSFSSFQDYP